MSTYRVYVCHNTFCKARGAQAVWQALRREARAQGAAEAVECIVAGCQGRCDFGPNLTIHPGATKYCGVTPEDVVRIIGEHVVAGNVVEELVFREW